MGLVGYTGSLKTKIDSLIAGAKDRTNHVGVQPASTVTGLSVVATTGSYNDLSNKPAAVTAYSDEQAQDASAALFAAGSHSGITFAYDDAGNRISATVTGGSSGNGTPATVDGAQVGALAFTTSVGPSDVGALPLPSGTAALGQVPVVSALSPLALGWGTASSGGNGGSSPAVGTRLNLITSFGGKNDGVMTVDLTVTANSKSISTAIAPFTDTATDKGKLVIWLTGATTEVGVIDTVQSTTQATLVNAAVASSVQFGGPNGNGAIGSDNTAALNLALAAMQAKQSAAGFNRQSKVPVPALHIPGGIYLFKPLNVITQPGGMIMGDGREQTLLVAAVASGTMFQHGTFNANPQDAFQGTAFNWTYRDLSIIDATRISTGTETQRTVTGIVDYGCGGIHIENCRFTGLKYGFAGAHGSDFSDIRYSFFNNCDVGYYFGPGSQQVEITKTDVADSREGAVFEGAPHWAIHGGSFEDLTQASVTIEGKANNTRTRFGVLANLGGAFYSGNFIIDGGVWFETNAGGNGRLSPRIILFTGDGPYGIPCEGLTVRDAYVISGGSQQSGGTNTVVEYNSSLDSPQPVIIDGLYMSDPSYANSIFRATGSSATARPRLDNIRKPSNVALTQGNVTPKYINRDGTMRGFTTV